MSAYSLPTATDIYRRYVRPYAKAYAFFLGAAILLIYDFEKLAGFRVMYEDDTYYYFVIARNIVTHGLSTFDGQTLTNGYHPLWLLVLVVQYALTGSFGIYPNLMELAFILGGLALFLGAAPIRSLSEYCLFALAYVFAVFGNTLIGMESSLAVLCLSALIYGVERFDLTNRKNVVATALIGAACIGARLESSLFVVPLLFLSWPQGRARLTGFALLGALGAVYVGFNLAVFHSALPISATIKSLGGLQVNGMLLDQLAGYWRYRTLYSGLRDLWTNGGAGDAGSQYLILVSLAAIPLYFSARGRPRIRRLLGAYLIGIALYEGKLLFGSSWPVWPWYYFPLVFGIYACLRGALPLLRRQGRKEMRLAIPIAAIVLAVGLIVPMRQFLKPQEHPLDYFDMGGEVISQYGEVLGGAPVAMGDRAGGFAVQYKGPVVQLEGLVGDREYLLALRGETDMRQLLCRRNVRYIIDYEPDLGEYQTHNIDILAWTDYEAPEITVNKADEVGRVYDERFKGAGPVGDVYIYIWRLSGCTV